MNSHWYAVAGMGDYCRLRARPLLPVQVPQVLVVQKRWHVLGFPSSSMLTDSRDDVWHVLSEYNAHRAVRGGRF